MLELSLIKPERRELQSGIRGGLFYSDYFYCNCYLYCQEWLLLVLMLLWHHCVGVGYYFRPEVNVMCVLRVKTLATTFVDVQARIILTGSVGTHPPDACSYEVPFHNGPGICGHIA